MLRGSAIVVPALVVVSLVALGWSGSAEAYVRSRTEMGEPFYWKVSCVPATIYLNGFDKMPGQTIDRIVRGVAAAGHAWGPSAVTCPGAPGAAPTHPYLEIVPTLSGDTKPPDAVWDSKNSIIFRTEMWSKSGKPPVKPTDDFDFDALAVTTVTARLDGHIVDADIEINALTKTWLDFDPGVLLPPDQGTFAVHDLQNTLTHEFGHFVGLDHTCYNPASNKVRPLDDQGQDVPDCGSAAAVSVSNTVMFDRADPGETSKRTLSDDEVRALCEIYAPSADPRSCSVDQPNDGCAVAFGAPARRTGTAMAWAAALLAAGAFVAARRRARRRG